ncbi:MAG: LysR family transcriptional regulator substrate-binding protein [Bradyrhizobium sp.]
MLLVGPVSAKLSMRRETPIKALAELPLILTTRPNSLRLTIETGLGVHGLQPNVRFEANTLPLMTDLVTADLGLAQNRITASPIAGLFITWLVARPKARTLGVAAERFYDMLCELGRKQVRDGIWKRRLEPVAQTAEIPERMR